MLLIGIVDKICHTNLKHARQVILGQLLNPHLTLIPLTSILRSVGEAVLPSCAGQGLGQPDRQ